MKLSDKEWLLKIAAEVEQDPSRWTTLTFARNAAGSAVSCANPAAVCWCAAGFQRRDGNSSATPSLQHAGGIDHAFYNDSLANATEFVAWFRRAAELCE